MTQANRATIEHIYAAAQTGDMAGIAALLDDDCVLLQAAGHPSPGRWQGRDAVMEGLGKVFVAIRMNGVTTKEIIADGPERVVGLVETTGTYLDGKPYVMPVAEFFLVRGGKVVEIRPFYWDLATLTRGVIAGG